MKRGRFAIALFTWIVLTAILAGCTPAPLGGVSAWIDVPLDGLFFPELQAIKIEGHAAAAGGVSRVEVWIDGALLTTITNPPMEGELASFHAEWTPSAPGEYTIQAIAFSADGAASQPDSARVTFGEAPVTPVVSVTPVITDTPTPVITLTPVITVTNTSRPDALIQFWADPAQVQAGACTTIRWHVENVKKVIFGGVAQSFDGSFTDCLCQSRQYSLRVYHLDGSDEWRTLDVNVKGSCITPTVTTPSDTTPPPAPTPAVPANGLTIACKASQSLVWLPVTDPSGIAEYQVVVQRHSGDNNWTLAPGGVISVTDKTTSVPVECGWYYRWRVRAVDGAGNVGGWSLWWLFAITLT